MNKRNFVIALLLSLLPAVATAQTKAEKVKSKSDCPSHDAHQGKKIAADSPDHGSAKGAHYTAVDSRGDKAMGFSHKATVHHFRILADGGAIEAEVNDRNDAANTDAIRQHMKEIAKMFAAGNFQTPMFIHGVLPPGVPTMKKLGKQISYRYEETGKGARIRISTKNSEALKSIQEFMRFQIDEHRTGDEQE